MNDPDCLFCKIVNNEIPSEKVYESDLLLAFMDIGPLSEGHCLVIPKHHAEKLDTVPDNALGEVLIVIKKAAKALNLVNYNILQNNGRLAHQAVGHVHFHLIPKPSSEEGLKITWEPIEGANQEAASKILKDALA